MNLAPVQYGDRCIVILKIIAATFIKNRFLHATQRHYPLNWIACRRIDSLATGRSEFSEFQKKSNQPRDFLQIVYETFHLFMPGFFIGRAQDRRWVDGGHHDFGKLRFKELAAMLCHTKFPAE